MSLITGLVCAINVYFVVDFLPTLRGLGYLIPLGLLLVAYVAFVTYLVRAEGGWGSVCVGGGGCGAFYSHGACNECPLCLQLWTCSIAHGARFLARGRYNRFSFDVTADVPGLAGPH